MLRILCLIGCLLSAQSFAAIIDSNISANSADFTLAEGVHSVELTLSFDRVVGLTETSAGIDSYLFSATDPSLLARLPAGVAPVAAFPMMVVIEPPATEGLAFEGAAEASIHTDDLDFHSDYRLFKAPLGGSFEDVTASHGAGSYRARARVGNWSEWLVVVDNRDLGDVVALKYQRLDDALSDSGLPVSLLGDLHNLLNLSRLAWQLGDSDLALSHLEALTSLIEGLQGEQIDNVWRSSRDLDNLAGRLLGLGATLRFSLLQG